MITPTRTDRLTEATMGAPHNVPIYPVTVRKLTPLSPHMTRITLAGPGLSDYTDTGPDQRFKLLLPHPGQDKPMIPGGTDPFAALRAMPADQRPIIRTYTIRHIHRDRGEIDVDFALHADIGPGSAWASRARIGDEVAITAAKSGYNPPIGTTWLLLAGDESALPAIGAILERRPAGLPAHVWIEVADANEHQELSTASNITTSWLHRGATAPGGTTLLDALCAAPLPPGRPYAWIAAEADAVKSIRRHLFSDRGVAPEQVKFSGYWKSGGSVDDGRGRREESSR
jgi:NADPH-dependent ferric siderophore reductase